MDWASWEPLYAQILADFGYPRVEDEAVADILDAKLDGQRIDTKILGALLRDRAVTVLGNGPNLEDEIGAATGVILAADEATTVALGHGLRPDAITTDLDGWVQDQVRCNREGTIALVLGHGDNRSAVETWAPRFGGPTMAMTQARPRGNLHNFGGFTDGDRAVFLAHHFGARTIRLLGFDFIHPSPKDAPGATKLRKLAWAQRLISQLRGPPILQGPG